MPYYDFKTMPSIKIWDGINGPIAYSEKVLFGYLNIDDGAILPVHQHPHEQWSHLLEGSFEFNVDGDIKMMTPGMSVYIPSNTPHSGRALSKVKFLDCFYPVREDWLEKEKLASIT
jgi:quercetin dioxygenase-like cupin family protein